MPYGPPLLIKVLVGVPSSRELSIARHYTSKLPIIKEGGAIDKSPVRIQTIIFAIVAFISSAQIELGRIITNHLSVIKCAVNNFYSYLA